MTACLSSLGGSFAAWTPVRKIEETHLLEKTADWNESLKYIVFAGLDDDGKMLDIDKQASDIDSFVAVGYIGLIDHLEFPNTYTITVTIDDEKQVITRSVTKILVLSRVTYFEKLLFLDGEEYASPQYASFDNIHFLSKITISASITSIASATFIGLPELSTLVFQASSSAIVIGDQAFAACTKLTSAGVSANEREIKGTQSWIIDK
jgi:hypothetical protein